MLEKEHLKYLLIDSNWLSFRAFLCNLQGDARSYFLSNFAKAL